MIIDYKNFTTSRPSLGVFRFLSLFIFVLSSLALPSLWRIQPYGKYVAALSLVILACVLDRWCTFIFRKAGASTELIRSFVSGEIYPCLILGIALFVISMLFT